MFCGKVMSLSAADRHHTGDFDEVAVVERRIQHFRQFHIVLAVDLDLKK